MDMKRVSLFICAAALALGLGGCTAQTVEPLVPAARAFGPPLVTAVGAPLIAHAVVQSVPAADSPYMHHHSLQTLMDGPEDRARVVFMRPSHFNHVEKLLIVDGAGRYLGDSLAESYFTADVEPGTQMFVGVGAKAAPVDAMLEAGKTYYVLVRPHAHMTRRTTFELLRALPERDPIDTWLRESTRYEADTAAGQAWLDSKDHQLQPRLLEASKRLWHMQESKRRQRTLLAADGR